MSAGTIPPPVVAPPITTAAAPPAAPPVVPAAVPEWLKTVDPSLHDSFKQYASVADALKAHNELRTKLGTAGAAAPPGDMTITPPPVTPATPPDSATAESITAFIETAGLKAADVSKQWNEHGALTDAQYKSLAGKGLSKAAVDEHLTAVTELRQYKIKDMRAQAEKIVGGEQQLNALIQWGKQPNSLKPEELAWYNEQVTNPANAARAVEWLAGRYRQAAGAGGAAPLIEGGGASFGVTAFASQAEVAAAMNHPDYNKPGSEHYIRTQARIAATPNLASLR